MVLFWTLYLRRSFGDLRHIQVHSYVAAPFMSGRRLLRRRRLRCELR